MIRTLTLSSLTAALMASAIPAQAEPVLLADISVQNAIVTVGDMFANPGINAERPLFRAPAPGTAGTVSVAAIKQAAEKAGVTTFNLQGLTQVRVARYGVPVHENDLTQLISNDLQKRGIAEPGVIVQVAFAGNIANLNAASADQPVRLDDLRYMPGSSSFTAQFTLAGAKDPLKLSGRIDMMVEVPHLTSSLAQGAVIGADDIEMKPVALRYAESSALALPEQLVGKALKRPAREGMVLRVSDVEEQQIIKRSEMVTLRFTSGPMNLTIKGQALNAAAMGEPVAVLNLVTKKIVHGTATDFGLVDMSAETRAATQS